MFLVAGCAMNMFRAASVTINLAPNQSLERTSAFAGVMFRDVANQIGFVMDPVQSGTIVVYTAHSPQAEPKNRTNLIMIIDNRQIIFAGNIYGTKEDFSTATNAVALFEWELDKRHISYRSFTAKSIEQGSPF